MIFRNGKTLRPSCPLSPPLLFLNLVHVLSSSEARLGQNGVAPGEQAALRCVPPWGLSSTPAIRGARVPVSPVSISFDAFTPSLL